MKKAHALSDASAFYIFRFIKNHKTSRNLLDCLPSFAKMAAFNEIEYRGQRPEKSLI